jgi:hypothetical protein
MRTQSDRLRTAAHLNRGFARSAELGTLEADEPKSVDFYLGRADAYEEAARFLDAADTRIDPPGYPD